MSRIFTKIILAFLLFSNQALCAVGEWYIKGEVVKVNKTAVVVQISKSKSKIAIPLDMIKPDLHKIGAKIIKNIKEEDLLKMASIKSGGGSK